MNPKSQTKNSWGSLHYLLHILPTKKTNGFWNILQNNSKKSPQIHKKVVSLRPNSINIMSNSLTFKKL
jgi:hypothetical protein